MVKALADAEISGFMTDVASGQSSRMSLISPKAPKLSVSVLYSLSLHTSLKSLDRIQSPFSPQPI